MEWESIIGLEIHVQLATQSKLFSGARNLFGAGQNENACPLDLGFPGTLPVINQEAVRMACTFGFAVNASINQDCYFDRKNYFYPDLPKGYQMSQSEKPIVKGGQVELDNGFVVQLTRAHLEEDAGKSIHGVIQEASGIDLNRAGTPLLEIVTEPMITNAQDAAEYFRKIHSLVKYLKISTGHMAEGALRCDANVSIRPKGESTLGTRTEIKNLNSFKFIEKAIDYEIDRHIYCLENNIKLTQETRLYDPDKNETRSMRSKEEANDYRYFPDPDLLPLLISNETLDAIQKDLPELSESKKSRYIEDYQLSDYDAAQLAEDIDTAKYFETVIQPFIASNLTSGHLKSIKKSANWILTDLYAFLNKQQLGIDQSPILPIHLSTIIEKMNDGSISQNIGKKIFDELCQTPSTAENAVEKIIDEKGYQQVSDTGALLKMIEDICDQNPKQVEQFIQANDDKRKKMFGFFIGKVMQASKGQANPQTLNGLIEEVLLKKNPSND